MSSLRETQASRCTSHAGNNLDVAGLDELTLSLRNMAFVLSSFQREPAKLEPEKLTGTLFTLHCQISRVMDVLDRMALPEMPSRGSRTLRR